MSSTMARLVSGRRVDSAASSPVLFIHGSLSSRRMWAAYETALAPRGSIAVDLPGYGEAATPAEAVAYRLTDVVRTIRPMLSLRTPMHVVAHSFGGAVALRLAIESPSLVRSLTLIEPTCFFLLRQMGPGATGALLGIERLAQAFTPSHAHTHPPFAMARFVDYWNGQGTWAALPRERQQALALKSDQVRRDFAAILGERLPFAALRRLAPPTLIVTGTTSPAAALCVAAGLTRAASRACSVAVPGAGHMLPMTHGPELIRILRARLELDARSDLRAA
jgi:pimeloyl-ACP methyl ester carboxylesterase